MASPFKKKRDLRAALRVLTRMADHDKAQAVDFLGDLKAGLFTLLGRHSEELTKFGFRPQVVERKPARNTKVV